MSLGTDMGDTGWVPESSWSQGCQPSRYLSKSKPPKTKAISDSRQCFVFLFFDSLFFHPICWGFPCSHIYLPAFLRPKRNPLRTPIEEILWGLWGFMIFQGLLDGRRVQEHKGHKGQGRCGGDCSRFRFMNRWSCKGSTESLVALPLLHLLTFSPTLTSHHLTRKAWWLDLRRWSGYHPLKRVVQSV